MRKRLFFAGLGVVLCMATACSKCADGKKATRLMSYVPSDAPAVLVFEDMSKTIKDFASLEKKFSTGPAATFLNQGKIELTRRLGFDPFSVDGWKKIGMAPEKGLALVLDPRGSVVIAGVANRKAFETELKKKMKELTAADQVNSQSKDDIEITTLSAKIGERTVPRLHYALNKGFALMCGPTGSPDLLSRLSTLDEKASLATAAWYTSLKAKLPEDADLSLFINGDQAARLLAREEPETAKALENGLAASFSMADDGLTVDTFLGLKEDQAKKIARFVAGDKDAHLEKLLPAGTVFALKSRIDVSKALDAIFTSNPEAKKEYDQSFQRADKMLGQNVQAATIRNFGGNAVMGFSLTSPEKLNQVIASGGRDNEQINAAFKMFVWLSVIDGAALTTFVDKAVSNVGEDFPVKRGKEGPLDVLTMQTEKGFWVNLMLHGNTAGICLGEGCVQEAASLVTAKKDNMGAGISSKAKELFNAPALVVGYLDFGKVVEALSNLDASLLGKGGMAMKMILDMAIGAVKNMKELTASINPEADGVAFRGHVEIQ